MEEATREGTGGREPASGEDAAAFWERRYGERERIWSGEPNGALVATVTGLPPGRALDLGCGEGGDALWLAEVGWQVTAVDITPTAVARAQAAAAARGVPDGRIAWVVADLGSWGPPGTYELVSACFLHSPVEFPRTDVLRRAASTVTPGGHLLLVGHAGAPPWAEGHGHGDHRFPGPAEELAGLQLDEAEWETALCEVRARPARGPDGAHATLEDGVVLLRRR